MPELLAPVRDDVSFSAALHAGADAVYFGLGQLNMRINSRGFNLDQLPQLVKTAHLQNTRVYVTLNSLVYDSELDRLDEILHHIKASHADAVICWDFAVIEKARQLKIPIHISTQASAANTQTALFYQNLGAQRLVLARELTLDQIKKIKQNTTLQIEVFVHGALCVSVSGRCFMSQHLFNRSANRGDCLQPCRRAYHIIDRETNHELELSDHYVMSPKDLCTLPIIDKLIAAGIDSFKIEGRSRPPEYISTVTAAYRQAIDAVAQGTFDEPLVQKLIADVSRVYNRGFSTGFLFGEPAPQDWSSRPGSAATQRKQYVGPVLNFFKKSSVAYCRIQAAPLSIGDTVQAHGPTTGVVEFKITQLLNDQQHPLNTAQKTKATFPCPHLLRKNDKIYKLLPT
ncbi:MAG: U32 family peptidase [Sedimentisphaerales bacterium]|nr:U32 family peptidase [Sedimentisphaerales bacterium]